MAVELALGAVEGAEFLESIGIDIQEFMVYEVNISFALDDIVTMRINSYMSRDQMEAMKEVLEGKAFLVNIMTDIGTLDEYFERKNEENNI